MAVGKEIRTKIKSIRIQIRHANSEWLGTVRFDAWNPNPPVTRFGDERNSVVALVITVGIRAKREI